MIFLNDSYLISSSQTLMGSMFDFAEYGLDIPIEEYYDLFCNSRYARKIEAGDSATVMGKSGIEIAYDVSGRDRLDSERMSQFTEHAIIGRSPEFWVGWAMAYYQKKREVSFLEITDIRNIDDILAMYKIYHELDIEKFCDRMDELYREKNPDSRLKIMRQRLGYSQSEVSRLSGIPLKTIQHYEQRQKDINHARVDYLISLSKVLSCEVEMLIEKI